MRVLFVQPSLQPPGGGSAVAAWMVEALRDRAEVSILAWDGVDPEPINRFFDTTLTADDYTLYTITPRIRRLLELTPTPQAMLRMHLMVRRARALHAEHAYDVFITANNEADFGVRGIQYVHYPWASFPRPRVDLRWFHYIPGVLRGYWALCGAISDFSWQRMRSNLTLVNSRYIADKTREVHGLEPTVLHPPVPGAFPDVPWEARRDDFVCVGRLSDEKELPKVIRIMDRVRARGHDVRLHLVGSPDDAHTVATVRALVDVRSEWITLHEDLTRSELLALLTASRYGIHGMVGEHFGIAVAELQRAGCITFVPDVGGPREIVGEDPRLLYGSEAEAIARIDDVLRDRDAQAALRTLVHSRRDLFSCDRFVQEFRALVDAFVADGR